MREKKKKAKKDPYAWQQAQLRKNGNLERRAAKKAVEDAELGHPIWGKSASFAESFDSAGQSSVSKAAKGESEEVVAARELPTSPHIKNHFLSEQELEKLSEHAYSITKPVVGLLESQLEVRSEEDRMKEHGEKHNKAMEALKRITSMENANAKDRFHANVRRIVEEFGRHRTDKFLEQKPESINPSTVPMPGRAGPDTGSSEVQIAILTVKIRALAQALEGHRGYKDKINKRNLRMLLHRRQKLMKYLERKEKGSGRWSHLVEKLGLSPATWKGQIEL